MIWKQVDVRVCLMMYDPSKHIHPKMQKYRDIYQDLFGFVGILVEATLTKTLRP